MNINEFKKIMKKKNSRTIFDDYSDLCYAVIKLACGSVKTLGVYSKKTNKSYIGEDFLWIEKDGKHILYCYTGDKTIEVIDSND